MSASGIGRRRLLAVAGRGWCAATLGAWAIGSARAQGGNASIRETAEGGGAGGGTFFVITTVDGVATPTDALRASRSASFGRGAYMTVLGHVQAVPAGRRRLALLGKRDHAAPIQTLFSMLRGTAYEVSGTVEVELAAGQQYRVNGLLDGFRREVWIEDAAGSVLPGSLVKLDPDPEFLKAMDGAGFAATNLRYEGDWISNAPWPHLPFVPLGARIKALDYGRHRADVMVEGRKMRIGVDYARELETPQAMFARISVAEDPRQRLAAWPERARQAVSAARVTPGMTREQVLVSLGRPRLDLVPNFDATEWRYHTAEWEEIFVVFDDKGLLREVDASRKARGLVLYTPPPGAPAVPPAAAPPAPAASAAG